MTGPSGVGKGTLISMLLKDCPSDFQLSTSHTTRAPRAGEVDGVHYWFVSRDVFEKGISNGDFIEYNNYNGNLYGTSVEAINKIAKQGKTCVLDIDINGAINVKKKNVPARFIFIKPPGEDPYITLTARLKGRGTETDESLKRRLEIAREELTFAGNNPYFFDCVMINDNLDVAYNQLKTFLSQE